MTDLFTQYDAVISPCGSYRYVLTRRWKANSPLLVFFMLNPSTADAQTNDPTIVKCMGFARLMGYGGIMVLNLYAYRATKPQELKKVRDPVGPDWERHFTDMGRPYPIICGWGAHANILKNDRDLVVFDLLKTTHPDKLFCFGVTKEGFPRHPLFVPYNTKLQKYDGK